MHWLSKLNQILDVLQDLLCKEFVNHYLWETRYVILEFDAFLTVAPDFVQNSITTRQRGLFKATLVTPPGQAQSKLSYHFCRTILEYFEVTILHHWDSESPRFDSFDNSTIMNRNAL